MNPYLFFDLAVLAFVSTLVQRKVGRGAVPASDNVIAEEPPACNWKDVLLDGERTTTLECNATSVDESWKNQSEPAMIQTQPVRAAANQPQTHAVGVDSSNVRRHEPLEFGTPAMCNNSDSLHLPQRVFPCMILAHSYSNGEVGDDLYSGSRDEGHAYHVYGIEGYESYHLLPASRIAPIRDSASAKSHKFKALYASFDPSARYPSQRQQYLHGVVEIKEGSRRHPPYVVVGHGDGGYLLKSALAPDVRAHSSQIRPYSVYENGTPSMCNIGTWDHPHHVRCTIVGHYFVVYGHGRLRYEVSYTEGQGVEKEDDLSFEHVQRIGPYVVVV